MRDDRPYRRERVSGVDQRLIFFMPARLSHDESLRVIVLLELLQGRKGFTGVHRRRAAVPIMTATPSATSSLNFAFSAPAAVASLRRWVNPAMVPGISRLSRPMRTCKSWCFAVKKNPRSGGGLSRDI